MSDAIWGVIPAFQPMVLERIRASTLLENAVALYAQTKNVKRVIIGTSNKDVAKAAKSLVGEKNIVTAYMEGNERDRAFSIADKYVAKVGVVPCSIVAANPMYPFQSPNTLDGIYRELRRKTCAVPVIDVLPGLVQPVGSMYGHRYYPDGARPHESYEAFKRLSKVDWTIGIVTISTISETFSVTTTLDLQKASNMANGLSFEFSMKYDYREMYVPTSNASWGAFIPKDADFVYDSIKDLRTMKSYRRLTEQLRREHGSEEGHRLDKHPSHQEQGVVEHRHHAMRRH